MNKNAYNVMVVALEDAISEADGFDVDMNSIANKAAQDAADKGYHWCDYPRAWDAAREETIWS